MTLTLPINPGVLAWLLAVTPAIMLAGAEGHIRDLEDQIDDPTTEDRWGILTQQGERILLAPYEVPSQKARECDQTIVALVHATDTTCTIYYRRDDYASRMLTRLAWQRTARN